MADGHSFRFALGDTVIVRRGPPERHCRTPMYLRGQPGVVTGIAGLYRDPSKLAFHKPGLPVIPLYRVAFRHADLWQDAAPDGDENPDRIVADLYEHWLEPLNKEPHDGTS